MRGSNGNGFAGMHTHRVKVFNRTNDDNIIGFIPHYFQFVFFPAQHRFLNHHFRNHAGSQSALGHFHQFFTVVGHATARSAKGKRRTDDQWKTDFIGDLQNITHGAGKTAFRHAQTDIFHRVPELFPVFRFVDNVKRSPDHFHFILFKCTAFRHGHGSVQSRLSAQRGKQSIRRSRAIIFVTASGVIGSIYVRSAIPGRS